MAQMRIELSRSAMVDAKQCYDIELVGADAQQ